MISYTIMENIPAELTLEILSYVDLISTKNFRLTCKRYAELGLEQIVGKARRVIFEHGFASIISISGQPQAAKYVRTLTYSRTYSIIDYPTEMTGSNIYNPKSEEKRKLLTDFVRRGKQIIREHEDFAAFKSSIEKFSNLENINIFCGAPIGFEGLELACWKRASPAHFLGVREMEAIQLGVLQADRKINSLCVKYLSDEYFIETAWQTFGQAWASVTKLDLYIVPLIGEWNRQNIKLALQQLPCLRELHLRFFWDWSTALTPLDSVLDSNFTFNTLLVLTLEGVVSNEGHFTSTMEAGLATIECLTLSQFKFSVSALKPVLTFIRERKLKKVELHGLIEGDENRYVYGGNEQKLEQVAKWLTDPELQWPQFDNPQSAHQN